MITKEALLEVLHTATAMVSFTKKDGTVRDMQCTLKSDLLPAKVEVVLAEGATPRAMSSTDSISVYDLEKSAWRSFNLSNVISYSTIGA